MKTLFQKRLMQKLKNKQEKSSRAFLLFFLAKKYKKWRNTLHILCGVCYNKEKLIVWSNPQICLSQCFGKNQFQSLPY